MLNNITICGRLVRDPELRKTQNGTSVTTFTLAVERDFKVNDEKVTDFVDCVAFKGAAEVVANNFTKGRMCAVVGRLSFRPYQDKDGNNRRAAEVIVERPYFVDRKPVEFTDIPAGADDDLPF